VGKSLFCLDLLKAVDDMGLKIGGVISPSRFVDNHKVGIDILDISSREKRPLADIAVERDSNIPIDSLSTQKYRFDPVTVEWANNVIKDACPCDLLIIDELGPLELLRDLGFTHAIDVLRSGCYQLALVVIRPELIIEFQRRFPDRPIKLITLPADINVNPVNKIAAFFGKRS
jgi:nucleoside-triphosphatase THEP1